MAQPLPQAEMPDPSRLRDHDAFLQRRDSREVPASSGALHGEQRLGVPTFVWGDRAPAMGVARTAAPAEAARAHLRRHAQSFRLDVSDVDDAVVSHVHSRGNGPTVVRFTQQVDGVEVFRNQLNVLMDGQKNLVALSGYLAPSELASQARAAGSRAFRLKGPEAVANAFGDLTGLTLGADLLTRERASNGAYAEQDLATDVLAWKFASPARSKPVFFTLPDRLEPAYYVEVDAGPNDSDDSAMYAYVISAVDGAILFRRNLTDHQSYTYRVWADPTSFIPFDGPHGNDATPHPTGVPDGYQAPFIPPNVLTLQNYPFSRNDAWLPPGSLQTVGNNVDAYADLGAPDGFQAATDLRAPVSSPGVFDYTYDTSLPPNADTEQRYAAVTSLFYVNNFLHDFFYDSGFDETAGNAQTLNYGRGGIENDALRVEAQDYGGRNNANMSTPADGARPRMQMYVFNGVPVLKTISPPAIAGNHEAATAAGFGAQVFDLTGDLKLPPPANLHGCAPFDPDYFAGKIAYVERGPLPPGVACGFNVKALNAQNAGAIAVVIGNHSPGPAPGLGGTDPAVTVGVLSTTQAVGTAWKNEAAANPTGTITLQMRRTPLLDRDGTIDNAIVAHEWGHYISNRLVANSAGLVNQQGRAMGEGWADTVAMLMMVRDEDRTRPGNNLYQGVYAVAAYTSSGGANNGHYYGIRRVPYSTDMGKNALTLKHISNGVALPTSHPMAGGAVTWNSQYHASGEVWATMLWECYAALLNAHPFLEAQNRWKSYLVTGWKLTPPSPTFLEARDALLAAAAANDPADYQRFANAFAKRGAGFGARVPDRASQDHIGVVESFFSGSNLAVSAVRLDDSVTGCDQDGVLDVGETGSLSVTVVNNGGNALSSFSGTVTASGATSTLTFPSGNTLSFPALARGASATRSIPVSLTGVTGTPTAGLTIIFDEPSLPSQVRTVTHNPPVHYDEQATGATTETFESSLSAWASTTVSGNPLWRPNGAPGERYMHADNLSSISDILFVSPWLTVNPTGNFSFSFRHRHSFESTDGAGPFWDGGVVELSFDGITWYDFYLDVGVLPGYTAFLAVSDSPLSDRPAIVGMNAAFGSSNPWYVTTVNLSTWFAGETFKIRFRLGSDSAVSAYGWDLDTVTFNNLANAPFPLRVPETSDGTTCNRRPVADAGRPQTVNERTTVTLDGSASFDPDGQALTSFTWTQVGGPAVTLTGANQPNPTFTTEVDANQLFTFQLVVSDGTENSLARTVDILVVNVNRAPVANLTVDPASPIAERSATAVTLSGAGSTDEDGDTLNYSWAQTAGPVVTLTLLGATASFPLPEVSADTTFAFEMVADDGTASSAPATATVVVTNVDRAPTANAGEDATVNGRSPVSLSGRGADEDGDALSFAWTQSAGPAVTLTGADTASPSFTSPDVKVQTDVVFDLVVSANGADSAADSVTITVRPDLAPSAYAGVDLAVPGRTQVTLGAVGTDPEGDAISGYSWTQTAGTSVTLTGADTANPTFTSPDIKTPEVLTFSVVVTANALTSAADSVNVTVGADRAPTASAGGNRTVAGRTAVTLSGTGFDPEGDAITGFTWTQVSGPSVTLSGANTAALSFASPDVKTPTDLVFSLVVSANGLSSAPSQATVSVAADRAPVANAGADFTVQRFSTVTLSGSGTDPDGDAITGYSWVQTSGPAVTLSAAGSATPSFEAPNVNSDTVLTFAVEVTANGLTSAADEVAVTVVKVNRRPVAHGPNALTVSEREAVTLSAADSADPDGDPLTYAWTQIAGPVITLTGADSADLSFTAPEVLGSTVMSFLLVVTDDGGAESEGARVEVTVEDVNRAPVSSPRVVAGGLVREQVTLDAAASVDPDGDALTYAWAQTAGDSVELSATTGATVSFTAPEQAQTLTFRLTATDSKGVATQATVDVEITEPAGCGGCASSGAGSVMWGGALLLLALKRRRRA